VAVAVLQLSIDVLANEALQTGDLRGARLKAGHAIIATAIQMRR